MKPTQQKCEHIPQELQKGVCVCQKCHILIECPKENQPPTNENWETEFAKLWETDSQIYDKIIDFIRRLLIEEKQKWLKELQKPRI